MKIVEFRFLGRSSAAVHLLLRVLRCICSMQGYYLWSNLKATACNCVGTGDVSHSCVRLWLCLVNLQCNGILVSEANFALLYDLVC